MVGSPLTGIKSPMPKQDLFRQVERFIKTESASSIVLILCALIAMAVANSPFSDSYFQILNATFGLSVQHWINDGLMAIFFFLVGLEIKREIVIGELSSLRKAAMPVVAALGGMVVPALIYFLMSQSSEAKGWAIPIATDIAFALGVLSLFGSRIPASLKLFLLTLAIVDDLGAILVIATFYTNEISGIGILMRVPEHSATPIRPHSAT